MFWQLLEKPSGTMISVFTKSYYAVNVEPAKPGDVKNCPPITVKATMKTILIQCLDTKGLKRMLPLLPIKV